MQDWLVGTARRMGGGCWVVWVFPRIKLKAKNELLIYSIPGLIAIKSECPYANLMWSDWIGFCFVNDLPKSFYWLLRSCKCIWRELTYESWTYSEGKLCLYIHAGYNTSSSHSEPTGGIEEQHCAFASVTPHFSSSVDLDEYGSLLIAECAGFGFIHK